MTSPNNREYYIRRAAAARAMADCAADPVIAKVHQEFARYYEKALADMSPMPRQVIDI